MKSSSGITGILVHLTTVSFNRSLSSMLLLRWSIHLLTISHLLSITSLSSFYLLRSEVDPLTLSTLEGIAKYDCLSSGYLAWVTNRDIKGPPNKVNSQSLNNLVLIMVIVY